MLVKTLIICIGTCMQYLYTLKVFEGYFGYQKRTFRTKKNEKSATCPNFEIFDPHSQLDIKF